MVRVFMEQNASRPMDPEKLTLMLNRIRVFPTRHYGQAPMVNYNTIIHAALGDQKLCNLSTILSHPHIQVNGCLNVYAHTSEEVFKLLVKHEYFYSVRSTLEQLVVYENTEKLITYLQSDKFIIPTAKEVARIACRKHAYGIGLAIVFADPRIDLSLITQKELEHWVQDWRTPARLLDVLKKRFPIVLTMLWEKHIKDLEWDRVNSCQSQTFGPTYAGSSIA